MTNSFKLYQKTAIAIKFSTNTSTMLFLLYVILNLCISGKLSFFYYYFWDSVRIFKSAAFERITTSGSVKLDACILSIYK